MQPQHNASGFLESFADYWNQSFEGLGLPALRARRDQLSASVELHALGPKVEADYYEFFGDSPPHPLPAYDFREAQTRLWTVHAAVAQAYDQRRQIIVNALNADRLRQGPARDLVELARDTREGEDEDLEMAYALLTERTSEAGVPSDPSDGSVEVRLQTDQLEVNALSEQEKVWQSEITHAVEKYRDRFKQEPSVRGLARRMELTYSALLSRIKRHPTIIDPVLHWADGDAVAARPRKAPVQVALQVD